MPSTTTYIEVQVTADVKAAIAEAGTSVPALSTFIEKATVDAAMMAAERLGGEAEIVAVAGPFIRGDEHIIGTTWHRKIDPHAISVAGEPYVAAAPTATSAGLQARRMQRLVEVERYTDDDLKSSYTHEDLKKFYPMIAAGLGVIGDTPEAVADAIIKEHVVQSSQQYEAERARLLAEKRT